MSYHPANMPLTGSCKVCGGMLAKEVTTLQHDTLPQGGANTTVTMIQTVDYFAYVNSPMSNETQSITKVWCTQCGIVYNSQ